MLQLKANFACHDAKSVMIIDYNVIINGGLGEESSFRAESMHDIITKWGRRRYHDDTARF